MDEIPLNKYLADAGIGSRRATIAYIKDGLVTVNHAVVTNPAYRVRPNDTVRFQKKVVKPRTEHIYILFNKPNEVVTTTADVKGRTTVLDFIPHKARLFPVGRLDKDTYGLLLLTTDGQLAQQLAHPRYKVEKSYQVGLNSPLDPAHISKLKEGIRVGSTRIALDNIYYKPSHPNSVRVTIHSGQNRIVRRLFEELGYTVTSLDRVSYAGLKKGKLTRGKWRHLTSKEIAALKELAKK
jgi:23S rRNA pseudouridine2605 synthase